MAFIDGIKAKAKANLKTIVLPESEDERTIRAAAKVLEEGTAKIVKVNVDNCPAISAQYQVMSIPTLILFKDGQAVQQTVGFQPKASLLSLIEANK